MSAQAACGRKFAEIYRRDWQERAMNPSVSQAFDVVVVGCGIAGLSAALTAMENGARVAILERAPKEDRGGNTRWTDALLRLSSENEVSPDLKDQLARNSGYHLDPALTAETSKDFERWPSIVKTLGFSDPEIVARLANDAVPTLQWLKRFGVRFGAPITYLLTRSAPRMAPVGGGLALVEALAAAAEDGSATFFYETTARKLIQNEEGTVCGLLAAQADNRSVSFTAPSIVLASGGFEGNPEMLARYIGPRARYLRPVARGGYYNKGEGIRMALEIGAAGVGDFGDFHAEPLDPRSGAPEPVVMVFNYGILVNTSGGRFTDEAPRTVDACYEAISRRIFEQPDGIAYAVLDAGLDDVPGWRRAVRSDQPPIAADSIEALAHAIGLPAEALGKTIADFNAACPRGAFKPLEADGLRTESGYLPPKSNWSRRIERPPFVAFPIICGNCFTFGGIKINTRSQVLNADGAAIPGLYAAGEMTGLYYKTYTGSTSVLRGAVFGRIAGDEAAARALALRSATGP
jgi:tricarballylate dehydrogenase